MKLISAELTTEEHAILAQILSDEMQCARDNMQECEAASEATAKDRWEVSRKSLTIHKLYSKLIGNSFRED